MAESVVNRVISKRMVKKQQMRWTRPSRPQRSEKYRHTLIAVAGTGVRAGQLGGTGAWLSSRLVSHAHLAADAWTVTTTTTARHGIEPLGLLTGYLQACAHNGGAAPAGADLDPFLPWTLQGRARRPASDPGPGP